MKVQSTIPFPEFEILADIVYIRTNMQPVVDGYEWDEETYTVADVIARLKAGGEQTEQIALRSQDVASLMFVIEAQKDESAFDSITILEHSELFTGWDANLPLAVLKRGLIVQSEGKLYKLLHTLADVTQNGLPVHTPAVWALIGNPNEEYPQWVPWAGVNDQWMFGSKTTNLGKRWVSNVDYNVWEPGAPGVHTWDEVM